jgi:hypothetical protein
MAFLAGCSGSYASESNAPQAEALRMREYATTDDSGGSAYYGWDMAEEAEAYRTTSAAPEATSGQKIIQTAWVNLQTDRFDEVMQTLRRLAPDVDGFVESAELYDYYSQNRFSANQPTRLREFSIILRVPREHFDTVMWQVENLATVRSSNQSAEDVTARYTDLAGRLQTKYIEQERVLDMIGRAQTIEDLLALENRLGEINTDIELFQSQMTGIDRLSAFSTIHVHLSEVTTETLIVVSEGLGARMGQAFTRSVNGTVLFLQNVLIFLAGALIPFTFIGLLTFVGIKAAKYNKKKKEVPTSTDEA